MVIFTLMKRLLDLLFGTRHRPRSSSSPTARSEGTTEDPDDEPETPTPLIFRSELERITDETTAARTEGVETGGVLFGTRTPEDELLVYRATGPGPNAEHHAAQFSPDTEHAQQLLDRLRTDRDVVWIGTWHKHPAHMDSLSEGDVRQMREFVRDPDLLDEMLAIVVTHQGSQVNVNTFYMDEDLTPVRTGIDDVPEGKEDRYQSYCRYEPVEETRAGSEVDVIPDSDSRETQNQELQDETLRQDDPRPESEQSDSEKRPTSTRHDRQPGPRDWQRSSAEQSSTEFSNDSELPAADNEPAKPVSTTDEQPSSETVQHGHAATHGAANDRSAPAEPPQSDTEEGTTRQERVVQEYEDLQTHAAMRDVTLRQTGDGSEATSFIVRVVPANSNPLVFICAEGFPDDPPVVAVEGADSYEPLEQYPRNWSRQTAFREIVADILGSSQSPAR